MMKWPAININKTIKNTRKFQDALRIKMDNGGREEIENLRDEVFIRQLGKGISNKKLEIFEHGLKVSDDILRDSYLRKYEQYKKGCKKEVRIKEQEEEKEMDEDIVIVELSIEERWDRVYKKIEELEKGIVRGEIVVNWGGNLRWELKREILRRMKVYGDVSEDVDVEDIVDVYCGKEWIEEMVKKVEMGGENEVLQVLEEVLLGKDVKLWEKLGGKIVDGLMRVGRWEIAVRVVEMSWAGGKREVGGKAGGRVCGGRNVVDGIFEGKLVQELVLRGDGRLAARVVKCREGTGSI